MVTIKSRIGYLCAALVTALAALAPAAAQQLSTRTITVG